MRHEHLDINHDTGLGSACGHHGPFGAGADTPCPSRGAPAAWSSPFRPAYPWDSVPSREPGVASWGVVVGRGAEASAGAGGWYWRSRSREPAVTGGQSQREEGRYGAFQRAFRLPTIVDEAKIQATYKDGVLALRLPKHAAATPQGIPITG